jgi:hypothetical protein
MRPATGRTAGFCACHGSHGAGRANAPTPFRAVVDAAWRALNAKPMPTPGTEVVEEVLWARGVRKAQGVVWRAAACETRRKTVIEAIHELPRRPSGR